jgi:hypothetical protein
MKSLIHGQIRLTAAVVPRGSLVLVMLRPFAPELVRLPGSFFQTEWEQRRRERLLLDGEREIRAL